MASFQNYPLFNIQLVGSLSATNDGEVYTESFDRFVPYTDVYENKSEWGYWYMSDPVIDIYFYDSKWWVDYANSATSSYLEWTSVSVNDDSPWSVQEWGVPSSNLPGTIDFNLTFNLAPFNKCNILVSGIDVYDGTDLNGVYVLGLLGSGYNEVDNTGLYSHRPVYLKSNGSGDNSNWDWVYWEDDAWRIYSGRFDSDAFIPNSSSYYPFEVTDWGVGQQFFTGTPVVTFIPQNTHGLSPEAVALLTKCHGSVDNFLRLRNQGQV